MSNQQARKFLEGWVLHLNAVTKDWVRYWLVLRGSVLFLFTDDHTIPENLAGTLLIRSGVALHSLPSKKRFKFLLVTTSHSGHQQENVFRFDLQTEFNLWKCFLLGISQRKVPDVVSLPKDQLQALKMAIDDVSSSADSSLCSDLGSSVSDESPGNSLRSVIRQSSVTTVAATRQSSATTVEATICDDPENDALSRGMADLEQRRIEVSRRALTAAVNDLRLGSGTGSKACRVSESSDSDGFSMHSSVSSRNSSIEFNAGSTSSATFSHRMSDSVMRMPFTTAMATSNFEADNNNKELWNHKFHVDAQKNKEIPSWFVNCSREDAIHALTVNHHYGNVLMRPSSKFGKYVITLCRKHTGKTEISHYSVVRTTSGYKIDVRNEHQPLTSLSDVMEFFVSVAGTSTKPLTTNDVNLLTQVANDTLFDTSFGSTRTCTNSSTDTSHVIDTATMKEEFDSSHLIAGTVSSNFQVHPSISLPSYAHDSDYAAIGSFESRSVSSTISTETCRSSTEADVFVDFQRSDEDYQNLELTSAQVCQRTSSDRLPPSPPPASSKPHPLSAATSKAPTPPPASSKPPPPSASSKPPTPPPASSKPHPLSAATSKPPTPPPASSKPPPPAAFGNPPTPPPASSKPRLSVHMELPFVETSRSNPPTSPTMTGWAMEVSSSNGNESLGSRRLAPPTAPRKRSTIPTAVDMRS